MRIVAFILPILILAACASRPKEADNQSPSLVLGCERMDLIVPLLTAKRVGVVANHSSTVKHKHLVDSLLLSGINITKIFCPEHGFRGEADAGELIDNHKDSLTGIPIISLYGSKKKPSIEDFSGLDIILFDMQDVGVRFYTYISTMHYVMETAADMGIPVLVLDRPNPNGFYVDGPVLNMKHKSFVGMHPIPLVHGMTIGEFAMMINGEGWLNSSERCKLTVISCLNYTHDSTYVLPVRPSPNLPNQTSIYLYPSLGFFEGTQVSVGRGTDFPFQVFGHPLLNELPFEFTPESRPGASKNPPLLGKKCNGIDLRDYNQSYFLSKKQVELSWLIFAFNSFPKGEKFFNSYFSLLAGNEILQKQIEAGVDELTIRESWQPDIVSFMQIRSKYLLYPDFTLTKNDQ